LRGIDLESEAGGFGHESSFDGINGIGDSN